MTSGSCMGSWELLSLLINNHHYWWKCTLRDRNVYGRGYPLNFTHDKFPHYSNRRPNYCHPQQNYGLLCFKRNLHYTICFFSFPLVFYVYSCAFERSWKLKGPKSTLIKPPLPHRIYCSSNTSSEVSPLISWLYDITLHHHVTHFYFSALRLVCHVRIDLAQLICRY